MKPENVMPGLSLGHSNLSLRIIMTQSVVGLMEKAVMQLYDCMCRLLFTCKNTCPSLPRIFNRHRTWHESMA